MLGLCSSVVHTASVAAGHYSSVCCSVEAVCVRFLLHQSSGQVTSDEYDNNSLQTEILVLFRKYLELSPRYSLNTVVYDVIHVLLHHSRDSSRMSHVFSHSNRTRNKCLLDLSGEARSLLLGTTQFVTSIQGPTRVPSTKIRGTFESADFFIRIGLVNPHTETAYF